MKIQKKMKHINASLIRTLAKPQNYMTTAFNIKKQLMVGTSLGYEFSDHNLIDKFYNSQKLIRHVVYSKKQFQSDNFRYAIRFIQKI